MTESHTDLLNQLSSSSSSRCRTDRISHGNEKSPQDGGLQDRALLNQVIGLLGQVLDRISVLEQKIEGNKSESDSRYYDFVRLQERVANNEKNIIRVEEKVDEQDIPKQPHWLVPLIIPGLIPTAIVLLVYLIKVAPVLAGP